MSRERMGSYLRSLRVEAGFTQRALGHVAKLDYKRICAVERGVSEWYVGEFAQLCRALDRDPVQVFSAYMEWQA